MTDVDPHLQQAIVRLVRALDSMERHDCLIGALVPRLLMPVPPAQRTRDVDVVVDVGPAGDVRRLVRDLRTRGYTDVAPPMRLRDEAGVLADVIPFSDALAPEGRLSLPGNIETRTRSCATSSSVCSIDSSTLRSRTLERPRTNTVACPPTPTGSRKSPAHSLVSARRGAVEVDDKRCRLLLTRISAQ